MGLDSGTGSGGATILGIVLVIGSFPLLYWNERRAIQSEVALGEEDSSVHSVSDPSQVSPANEGKLVHVTGRAATEDVLSDAEFGISEQAIYLERVSQIYQWHESAQLTRDRTPVLPDSNNSLQRQFTFDDLYWKAWSLEPVTSDHFVFLMSVHTTPRVSHKNPAVSPFWRAGHVWNAREVRLGGYNLPPALVSQIDARERIPASAALLDRVPAALRKQLQIWEGSFDNGPGTPCLYLPQDPSQSKVQIGDIRFTFRVIRPAVVSILARQVNRSFAPFAASNGAQLFRLAMGEQSASSMFDIQHAESSSSAWGLRVVGFVLMCFGLVICLQNTADNVVLTPAAIAFLLTLCTIAAAWITYRPFVASSLFAAAAVGAYGLCRPIISYRDDDSDRPARRRKHVSPKR
jgi:Transmembrane protein 43